MGVDLHCVYGYVGLSPRLVYALHLRTSFTVSGFDSGSYTLDLRVIIPANTKSESQSDTAHSLSGEISLCTRYIYIYIEFIPD